MKVKIFQIIGLLIAANFTKAQIPNSTEIEEFIVNHTIQFNKKQKPIYCSNLDSMKNELEKANIKYSRCSYMFAGGALNHNDLLSGGCDTRILDKEKPFIFYNINTNGSRTLLIEVIEGNNYF